MYFWTNPEKLIEKCFTNFDTNINLLNYCKLCPKRNKLTVYK